MLTGRNEWIAIAALILYIAFVPCPYQMKQFFGTPIGKVVALSVFVYAWKYVSCPVAILLLVAFMRSGSLREYLEGETGMTPPASSTGFKCPDEFMYSAEKKMCMKGTDARPPMCTDPSMTWHAETGECKSTSTPGAAAAAADMSRPPPTVESFTPKEEKGSGNFAPAS